MKDTVRIEVFNRLETGELWGVRRDRMALAKASLFGGDEADVVLVGVENPSVYNRGSSDVHLIAPYEHRLWQPEDFL